MVEIKLNLSVRGAGEELEAAVDNLSLDIKDLELEQYVLFGGKSQFDKLEENLEERRDELESENRHVQKDKVEDCLTQLEKGMRIYHEEGNTVDM